MGFDYSGKTRTVDMHIKSIRSKLGESAKDPKYIITVHGLGYKVD
jgi:two-component system alkaline phosphatase synthesis response regulator PhoP